MTVSAAFFAEIAFIAFVVLFLNFFTAPDPKLIIEMAIMAAVSIAVGLVICFSAAQISYSKTRRHSRYTYLDIQLKGAVFSRYSESYRIMGEKVIFRELYYIPFKELEAVEISPDGTSVVVTGKIRRFMMDSDNLGYHVKDGDIEFDHWWLNIGGFSEQKHLVIPPLFGKAKRVSDSLSEAKKRFTEIPPPKKYEFKEAAFIRRRPKPRVMPENLDFSRSWK